MTQWSRFLPEFDWQPTVLCQYHGHLATRELIDEKLHPEVSVEYFNHQNENARSLTLTEKERFYIWKTRLAKSAIGHWAVPDIQIKFWRAARRKTREVIERVRPDAILTSSPPHSIHDLGMWASREFNIPCVADFRDPYLIDIRPRPRGLTRLWWAAHSKFEREIYDKATLITHAIPMHARWARQAYPTARARIVTLTNGSPPELADVPLGARRTSGRRSVSVVGALLSKPTVLLAQAIRRVVNQGEDLELRLVGYTPPSIKAVKEILGERLVATGGVAHHVALKEITEADVLVCSLDENRSGLIGLSSKLFEYLSTGKPTIVVNPTRPDRHLLRGLTGVKVLLNPDVEKLGEAIIWALSSEAMPSAEQVILFRCRYDRRTQTQQLAGLLDGIVSRQEPEIKF